MSRKGSRKIEKEIERMQERIDVMADSIRIDTHSNGESKLKPFWKSESVLARVGQRRKNEPERSAVWASFIDRS
jgi:hypothetical protein